MKILIPLLALNFSPLFAAGLTFSSTVVETSVPLGSSSAEVKFNFKNDSGTAVKITRMESECSCMTIQTTDKKAIYGPGESGELTGTFEIGAYTGTVNKTISVWLEGDPKPASVLKVQVTIPDLVVIEPRNLIWELGSNGPKTAVVRFPKDAPAKLIAVECSETLFTTSISVLEENAAYQVTITPANTEKKALGIVKLRIESKNPKQRSGQFYSTIK